MTIIPCISVVFFHSVFMFKEDVHFGKNICHRKNEVNFDLTGSPMWSLRRWNSNVLSTMKNLNVKLRASYVKIGDDLYIPCFLLNYRGSKSLLGLIDRGSGKESNKVLQGRIIWMQISCLFTFNQNLGPHVSFGSSAKLSGANLCESTGLTSLLMGEWPKRNWRKQSLGVLHFMPVSWTVVLLNGIFCRQNNRCTPISIRHAGHRSWINTILFISVCFITIAETWHLNSSQNLQNLGSLQLSLWCLS